MATFNPTGQEQEMLELLNRMRLNPASELHFLVNSLNPISSPDPNVNSALQFFNVDGATLQSQWSTLTPVQPLAWSAELYTAALGHSQAMITQDQQSHQLPGELGLGDRVQNAGYSYSSVSENIFAFSDTVLYGHAGFAIDWGSTPTGIQSPPGHRNNMMSDRYREAGIAIVPENNPGTDVGPLVITQNFGNRFSFGDPWLLGVVFNDGDRDNFYDNGEGLNNVSVSISGASGTFNTTTLSAGGYQVQVPAGSYTVTFAGGGLSDPITQAVTIGTENLKLDLNAADPKEAAPLLWRNQRTGQNAYWEIDGNNLTLGKFLTPVADLNWSVQAIGDLDADGKSDDLLWHHQRSHQTAAWLMENGELQTGLLDYANLPILSDSAWEIQGIGDFDGAGFADDIVYRHRSTGENTLVTTNGGNNPTQRDFLDLPDMTWEIAGIGALDYDGRSDDLLWHNTANGQLAVWYMNGHQLDEGAFIEYGATMAASLPGIAAGDSVRLTDRNWVAGGLSDLDADGRSDELIWRNDSLGQTVFWSLDGHQLVDAGLITPEVAGGDDWTVATGAIA